MLEAVAEILYCALLFRQSARLAVHSGLFFSEIPNLLTLLLLCGKQNKLSTTTTHTPLLCAANFSYVFLGRRLRQYEASSQGVKQCILDFSPQSKSDPTMKAGGNTMKWSGEHGLIDAEPLYLTRRFDVVLAR